VGLYKFDQFLDLLSFFVGLRSTDFVGKDAYYLPIHLSAVFGEFRDLSFILLFIGTDSD
jgi:hypothetical protein